MLQVWTHVFMGATFFLGVPLRVYAGPLGASDASVPTLAAPVGIEGATGRADPLLGSSIPLAREAAMDKHGRMACALVDQAVQDTNNLTANWYATALIAI